MRKARLSYVLYWQRAILNELGQRSQQRLEEWTQNTGHQRITIKCGQVAYIFGSHRLTVVQLLFRRLKKGLTPKICTLKNGLPQKFAYWKRGLPRKFARWKRADRPPPQPPRPPPILILKKGLTPKFAHLKRAYPENSRVAYCHTNNLLCVSISHGQTQQLLRIETRRHVKRFCILHELNLAFDLGCFGDLAPSCRNNMKQNEA